PTTSTLSLHDALPISFKGTRNVWVKRADEPFDKAKPITADTTPPIPAYFWSRDGKYILFVQDKAGDENYLVYAVNPNDSPAAGQDRKSTRLNSSHVAT